MEVKAERNVQITLILNEQEATWLRSYMQNPFCDPADEDAESRANREQIFTLLNKHVGPPQY